MISNSSSAPQALASSPIRICIVDDQTLFRETLAEMLSRQPGMIVAGQAADGEEAVRQAIRLRPDLIIMDIGLPKMDGLQATRKIREVLPAVRVVAITAYASDEFFRRALEAKVDSFILKDARLEDVLATIRLTHRGSRLFAGTLMQSFVARGRARHRQRLTERELEVLRALAGGASNRAIAAKLRISDKTVRNHISNIYAKLSVTGRAQAVLYAAREGIVVGHQPPPALGASGPQEGPG